MENNVPIGVRIGYIVGTLLGVVVVAYLIFTWKRLL